MAVLYFLCGFYLNGYAGITEDDVNLDACIGAFNILHTILL